MSEHTTSILPDLDATEDGPAKDQNGSRTNGSTLHKGAWATTSNNINNPHEANFPIISSTPPEMGPK